MYSNGYHFCGGILISSQYILTAAHCYTKTHQLRVKVFIGVHNRSAMESWVQTRNAVKFFTHEMYSKHIAANDIALIKLDFPVKFDGIYVVPACVDETGTIDVSNKVGWATGWGAQYYGGRATILKNQVSMNIFDDKFCRSNVGFLFNRQWNICGYGSSANSGVCQGDSGGPLVYKNPSDGRWYVVGISSWVPDGNCGQATVFVRVSNYISWIKEKIALN